MHSNKNKNKYPFLIFSFFLLVIIAFLSGYFIFKEDNAPLDPNKDAYLSQGNGEAAGKNYRLLDGLEVAKQEDINPSLTAIIIDNFIESRPVSGLSEANLVYETLAEAGITRFLAFYVNDKEIRKIGPVRSARPYFLSIAEEYQALFMHVGGSPDAIKALQNRDYELYNLDQFFNAQYFWREKLRKPPFNVYTSSDLFGRALNDRKTQPKNFAAWQFKDDLKADDRPADGVYLTINFPFDEYKVKWMYNRDNNEYTREEGGKIYLEEDEKQIKAKNVVIQVAQTTVLDGVGRREIKTEGEGKAIIFQDGKRIEGVWQKFRKGDRTKFFDKDRNEIKFNRGKTWIEIVPDENIIG